MCVNFISAAALSEPVLKDFCIAADIGILANDLDKRTQ